MGFMKEYFATILLPFVFVYFLNPFDYSKQLALPLSKKVITSNNCDLTISTELDTSICASSLIQINIPYETNSDSLTLDSIEFFIDSIKLETPLINEFDLVIETNITLEPGVYELGYICLSDSLSQNTIGTIKIIGPEISIIEEFENVASLQEDISNSIILNAKCSDCDSYNWIIDNLPNSSNEETIEIEYQDKDFLTVALEVSKDSCEFISDEFIIEFVQAFSCSREAFGADISFIGSLQFPNNIRAFCREEMIKFNHDYDAINFPQSLSNANFKYFVTNRLIRESIFNLNSVFDYFFIDLESSLQIESTDIFSQGEKYFIYGYLINEDELLNECTLLTEPLEFSYGQEIDIQVTSDEESFCINEFNVPLYISKNDLAVNPEYKLSYSGDRISHSTLTTDSIDIVYFHASKSLFQSSGSYTIDLDISGEEFCNISNSFEITLSDGISPDTASIIKWPGNIFVTTADTMMNIITWYKDEIIVKEGSIWFSQLPEEDFSRTTGIFEKGTIHASIRSKVNPACETLIYYNGKGTQSRAKIQHEDEEFLIYPNPTNRLLNIESNILNQIDVLEIYNPDGKKLISKNSERKSTINTMDVSTLDNGLYILLIIDTDGNNTTMKFAKTNN